MKQGRLLLVAVVLLVGCASAFAAQPFSNASTSAAKEGLAALPPVRTSEHLFGLPGLSNVGRVAPGIFRGAQPEAEGYATLKNMGIRTVINLRNNHSEKKKVEAAGMVSVEIPINIWRDPDPATFRKVVALLADPANQPVFLHCAHGQDRTGAVIAIYRMQIEGWNLTDAEEEMQSFGFNDIWLDLKDYVRAEGNGKGTTSAAR